MRRATLVGILIGFIAVLALAASPAHAENQLLRFKFYRAALTVPNDSVLVTVQTTTFDTTEALVTTPYGSTVTAVLDTISPIGGGGTHRNLWAVVEVTGTMASLDSLYLLTQYSQGPILTGTSANQSGDQNNPANWRWYAGRTAQGAVENSTGTQTFVFPIPCLPVDPNAWIIHRYQRFIIQGDTSATAKGFSTRMWLVWRTS